MNPARHPVRGLVSGFLLGFGAAVLALIYGLVSVQGPWLPLGIVTLGLALGLAVGLFAPSRRPGWPRSRRKA